MPRAVNPGLCLCLAAEATYQVSLIARKGTVALANTSAVSTVPSNGYLPATPLVPAAEKGPGKGPEKGPEKGPDKSGEKGLSAAESEWYLTKFEPTPKVSTYLVTWANGPFEHREVTMKSPLTGKTIPLRTYGTADVIDQTVLCLEASQQLIPLYEKVRLMCSLLSPLQTLTAPQLFDIPYPLSKLDTLVAHDFDAGAMEGWGLITCRTSVGLYDAKQSGLAAKKWVISVEAHECAHQVSLSSLAIAIQSIVADVLRNSGLGTHACAVCRKQMLIILCMQQHRDE